MSIFMSLTQTIEPGNMGKVACERVIRRKRLGSGAPPGLQNRRSSLTGDGVFDSHALPPAYMPPLNPTTPRHNLSERKTAVFPSSQESRSRADRCWLESDPS